MLNIVNGTPMPCRVRDCTGKEFTGYVRVHKATDVAYIYKEYELKEGCQGESDESPAEGRFKGKGFVAIVSQPASIECL